jgi:predicted RNA binding protein YcfA (HicA-like mRNA interferase family)
MKTHPELGLDPHHNGVELAVLGVIEVLPRPGWRSHRGVGDHARVVPPNQKAQGAIDVLARSEHNFLVVARVIKKNC